MSETPITSLMSLDEATRALAGMRDLNEVKQMKNLAQAALAYARAKHLGLDAQNHAGHIATRAATRHGELLIEMAVEGERARPGDADGTKRAPSVPTLADLGTNKRESAQDQFLAKEVAAVEEYLATAKIITPSRAIRAAQKAQRKRTAKAAPPLPAGLYNVVLVDPPWEYSNSGGLPGQANNHYGTMNLAALSELHLPIVDNAALFLWVTNPMLREAFTLIDKWGFEYKTNVVWIKTNLRRPGVGFYVRGRHELLFICTKGSMVPDQEGRSPIGSVIEADAPEHSRKPIAAYELIESIYPGGKYLELFARGNREGWTTWGDDSSLLLADSEANS